MYWLLDYTHQEDLRQKIIKLQTEIMQPRKREQSEQIFPFIGRKSRAIAAAIIENLTETGATVCDPFCGSGTFVYAAQDCNRNIEANEWEPYAYRMATAPFKGALTEAEYHNGLQQLLSDINPIMNKIYMTKCPKCEKELLFDALFFDRDPEEYYHPMKHERMGKVNGENVIFRQKYRCSCGCTEKHYDDFDEKIRQSLHSIQVEFPDATLIENSRLNFTAPTYTKYKNLFSTRQKIALVCLHNGIQRLPENIRDFFEDAFISIIHLGKYTDYRSKSQDNHCPENRLKETNLLHRYLEKIKARRTYILAQQFKLKNTSINCKDFREFFSKIADGTVDLVLTDPPYGDNAQYFEHAQRVHPFLSYDLSKDVVRLNKEVVISNARKRSNKHNKVQFLDDIETLIIESARVVKKHGFVVLYFRPEQSDWISDLNKLKHFGRKHGMEPIISIPVDTSDPSMRVIASAAWTFKNDVCFVFLKLDDNERRWYEGDLDVDELIYLAASKAATDLGNPFTIVRFNQEMQSQLRSVGLIKLMGSQYTNKIKSTLARYTYHDGAQYRLTGISPYDYMNKDMNAEIRLREFVPVVIEELTEGGRGFRFEEYVIHLATFMENGSREIIEKLHTSNRLIPELLTTYTYEDREQGKFYVKEPVPSYSVSGRINLRTMDPSDFEKLIADYFLKRGFVEAKVIGQACDRGVDILATNADGELELIQCKRYREGNNIGSTPIQRVDSYMRSRNAKKAWVVTTSNFTKEGRDEARITQVILVNGKDLIKSLELYYPGVYTL
ncbi:restriction endonuclease [Ohessyouella blattaphilus]|uniref:Restriction endonuclease n=1 Tax=Ohessyouella blattaphilus TaxID=2949333 RepID=A0ABT1EIF5_9FIRM|nr:restriction endonuclease [Ohessyouella blattaphilus]MCP1110254.1 restriction endonuclease [Ohessyouella blattaphilus]MCR8563648.1 restriction endonuclease [Ohessyouella blattaphilus]